MRTLENEESDTDQNAKHQLNFEKHEEEVKKLLAYHKVDDPYLDLSSKALKKLPSDLFILAHIQHLYLERNNLEELPDNFFDRLPALQWLDLRTNRLKSLPVSIGRHQSLKNLLLEGNKMTHLPLQLGLIKTLNGLSLQGNPLQFPPQHIIDQGVYVILSFLYQELQNRSRQSKEVVAKDVEKLQITVDDSEVEILTEDINLTGRKLTSPMSDDFRLLRNGLTPVSASFHRPVTYQEYKGKYHTSRLLDAFGDNNLKNNRDLSLLHLRHRADDRREKLRAMKERQSFAADQRRKSRTAQEKRRNDKKKSFSSGPDFSFQSPIQKYEPQHIEVIDDVREEVVEKVFSNKNSEKNQPQMVFRKNEAIQRRIKQHSHKIHDRMRAKRATEYNTGEPPASGELQRELSTAKAKRKVDLEYRFKAFTGDSQKTRSDVETVSTLLAARDSN